MNKKLRCNLLNDVTSLFLLEMQVLDFFSIINLAEIFSLKSPAFNFFDKDVSQPS